MVNTLFTLCARRPPNTTLVLRRLPVHCFLLVRAFSIYFSSFAKPEGNERTGRDFRSSRKKKKKVGKSSGGMGKENNRCWGIGKSRNSLEQPAGRCQRAGGEGASPQHTTQCFALWRHTQCVGRSFSGASEGKAGKSEELKRTTARKENNNEKEKKHKEARKEREKKKLLCGIRTLTTQE